MIYGTLHIRRPAEKTFYWVLDIGPNQTRRDVTVESNWVYLSRRTAIRSAERWVKRLGVTIVKEATNE